MSGTALDQVLVRRLQDGDPGGDVRRALAAFPVPEIADRIRQRYFIDGGKASAAAYPTLPLHTREGVPELRDLCVVGNFVEVWLAREGHGNPVGINYLEKIQIPHLPSIYGALLAGVDCILMGAGIPLKIAAKVDRADEGYFREKIVPLISDSPNVEFIGEINERQKSEFLGEASAVLFPIDWPEPFGLVMIEAMALGTPTIAFRCGSVPEVIENGVNGAIVSSEDEAVAALPSVLSLDRRKIRRRFEQRFTATRMAKDYLDLYHSLVSQTEAGSELRTVESPDLMTASRP